MRSVLLSLFVAPLVCFSASAVSGLEPAFAETLLVRRREPAPKEEARLPTPMYTSKAKKSKPNKVVLPRVETISLIDAGSAQTIAVLKPGMALDLAKLPTKNLALRADGSAETTRVVFSFDARSEVTSDASAPFLFPGTSAPWSPVAGVHEIAVTAYGKKSQGTTKSLRFRIFDSTLETTARTPEPKEPVLENATLEKTPTAQSEPRAMLVSTETETLSANPRPAKSIPARPVEDTPTLKTVSRDLPSETESSRKCVGLVNKMGDQVTVVCSHDFSHAKKAKVVLTHVEGEPATVCEFPNTASPMVTSCFSSEEIVSALHEGNLIVDVHETSGRNTELAIESE